LFFFFSSRRRHTRFSRDWSSDVCSSDLGACPLPADSAGCEAVPAPRERTHPHDGKVIVGGTRRHRPDRDGRLSCLRGRLPRGTRSEERRVGKERRSTWSVYHEKKKGAKT